MLRILRAIAVVLSVLPWFGAVASAEDGWSPIGGATIDKASEVVAVALDGQPIGVAVRLQARRGSVQMRAILVTYGQGKVHLEERPILLGAGERTRPIELAATDAPIRAIEIILAPGQRGAATLEAWARGGAAASVSRPTPTTAAPEKPAPALKRDPVTGQWEIGKSTFKQFGFDGEVVPVAENRGFKSITLEAKDRGVSLNSVKVGYTDGSEDTVPLRTRLEAGQKQEVALPSAKPVKSIAISARSRLVDNAAKGATATSTIAITGQAADAGTRTPASTSPAEAAREAAEAQAKSRPSSGGLIGSEIGRIQRRGGHVSGVPVDRTIVKPDDGRPSSVSRTSYASALDGLDACVKDKSCTPVPVFFGTDRNETTVQGRTSFGTERAGRVRLGRVFVTVPSKNRVAGELNVPGWTDWVRGTPEGGDPKRHFTIPKSGVTLFDSEAELIAAVKEHVASGIGTHKDHAFVYVHGYRTPWEFAAMRTAQIAYDLSPDDAPFGTPFLYSWPSQGAAADYITDLDHSRIAIPHLTGFLRMVAERTGASHIHVIAHSMGNFPVIHALARLAEEMPAKRFSEVVLAAPDVEKKEFEDVASGLVKIAKGVTLYASSSDIALLVSRLLRRDKPRAGDAKEPPGPALVAGIDTVDISRLSTGFMSYLSWNHDKYADSPVLLNDISTLFRTGDRRAPPNERNIRFRLQQAPAIQARFWRYED